MSWLLFSQWTYSTDVPNENVREFLIHALKSLCGYFCYDILIVWKTDGPFSIFILHHVMVLLMIFTTVLLGIPETWYHTAVCFVSEVTQPITNLRFFTKKISPTIYWYNRLCMLLIWLLFRIIWLPYLVYGYLSTVVLPQWCLCAFTICAACLMICNAKWFKSQVMYFLTPFVKPVDFYKNKPPEKLIDDQYLVEIFFITLVLNSVTWAFSRLAIL